MAVQNSRRNSAYGLSDALVNVFPAPIVARRVPATSDMAQVGTLWIDALNNNAYVLTSVQGNAAMWVTFSQGAATFSSLTVTPGPTSLTGAVTIDTTNSAFALTTGTGTVNISTDATDNSINIGTGAGEKTIDIGNTVSLTKVTITADNLQLTGGDAPLIISGDLGGVAIDGGPGGIDMATINSEFKVQTGTGAINIGTDAADHAIVIGNQVGATSIQLEAGTGGIVFLSDGIIAVSPDDATTASPGTGATLDVNIGSAKFTGFTTAAAATQAFVISNALCVADSKILVSVSNTGSNDAQMTLTRVLPDSGLFSVILTNNGAAALNGDIRINFWLLD